MHGTPLITTLVAGLGVAFVMGVVANRLRISPIVGYLIAGVLVGPYTPGIAADPELAGELAEVGVILLMFGVGLHFSLADLLSVRSIAIPGAIAKIAIATALGAGLGLAIGWPLAGSLIFGLSLSVASTVVLLRSLQERHMVESEEGHIAVGWLVVEDLAMVLALVLIPALAGFTGAGDHPVAAEPAPGGANLAEVALAVAITLGKVVAFIALMLVVGRRVIPWVLHAVAHTGSRELFRLAVLAIALGVAFGAAGLFDVSFALGAFFAGMVLNESALSQQAAQESLPFRDAFAVLFFVSVGMLFDPMVLVEHPFEVGATVAIILLGKSVAAYLIVRAFGYDHRLALTISVSLAQVGEFSFILAALGISLGLMTGEARDLILAGAIISIVVNPVLFDLLDRWRSPADEHEHPANQRPESVSASKLTGHAVVIGYGRVGSMAGESLIEAGVPLLVVEDNLKTVAALRERGIEAISGNGVRDEIMDTANLAAARWLLVAIPNAYEASQIVRHARAALPDLTIIARAHFDAEVESLKADGATVVIMGEREIARGMVEQVLSRKAENKQAGVSPGRA